MTDTPVFGTPSGPQENRENVTGMHAAPPSNGFGQLWAKDILIRLTQPPSPEEVVRYWRENLEELWPEGGDIYPRRERVEEGDVMGVDVGVGPLKLATGVVVIDADAHSFTVLAPEGHAFAGTNTFFAVDRDGMTTAGVSIVMRASDPFYELGLMFGGHRVEEKFWAQHLRNLAAHFGQEPKVRLIRRRLDRRRQWKQAANIKNNAVIRSALRRLPGLGRS